MHKIKALLSASLILFLITPFTLPITAHAYSSDEILSLSERSILPAGITISPPYKVTIQCDLQEVIKGGDYDRVRGIFNDWMNGHLNTSRYDSDTVQCIEGDVVEMAIFDFDSLFTYDEALQIMNNAGYEPAHLYEFLALGADYPTVHTGDAYVVLIDSFWVNEEGISVSPAFNSKWNELQELYMPKDLLIGGGGMRFPAVNKTNAVLTNNSTTTFADTTNHWAETYIDALYEKGIVKGRTDTTFEPDATINRAELVKMAIISKGLDVPSSITKSSFEDVPVSSWFAPYVEKAYTEGIVEGNIVNGKRYFRPNDPVIRAEALKILLYSANHKTFNDSDTTKLFSDVNSGDWFYNLVTYAKNNNIVSGYPDGSFKPARQVTRAEASKILHVLFFEDLPLGAGTDDAINESTSEPSPDTSPETISPDSTIHATNAGGDWDNPGTWIENRIPGTNDIVEITSHVYIDNQLCTDTTVKSLIIGTNGVLEPHNAGCITINGDMINDGTVNKSEDLSLIIEGDLTNNGSIEVTCMRVSGTYTNNGTIKENPYCWSSI